jgi:hypothetical protein
MKHYKARLQADIQYNIHGQCYTAELKQCSATVRGTVRMSLSNMNLVHCVDPVHRALIARFK